MVIRGLSEELDTGRRRGQARRRTSRRRHMAACIDSSRGQPAESSSLTARASNKGTTADAQKDADGEDTRTLPMSPL